MNGEGTLVYHPTKESMIGKNIFADEVSCYECHESFNAEKEILKSEGIGYSSYISPAGEDSDVDTALELWKEIEQVSLGMLDIGNQPNCIPGSKRV